MLSSNQSPFSFLTRGAALLLSSLLIIGWFSVILSPETGILSGKSDFIDCYTASQIIHAGYASSLYDIGVQTTFQRRILNSLATSITFADGVILYTHPPFAALFYLPLAQFSYSLSFLLWTILSLCSLAAALAVLWRSYELSKVIPFPFALLAVSAFLPVFGVVAQGQNTFVALFFLVLALRQLKLCKNFAAGMALSLVLVKFQILPLFLLVAFFKRRWRILAGFLSGSLVLFFLTLPFFDIQIWLRYFVLLRQTPFFTSGYGFSVAHGYCVRGQVYALLFAHHPGMALSLSIICALVLSAAALWAWHGSCQMDDSVFELRISLLVLTALLVAPLINFHDLSFLLLPACSIYQFCRRAPLAPPSRRFLLAALLIILYALPPIHLAVRRYYPIQPVVIGLLLFSGILLMQVRNAFTSSSPAARP